MIIFNEKGMITHASENPYPRIPNEICPTHVCRVWKAVFAQIHEQLYSGRGVKIPGLLLITYKITKQAVSHSYVTVNRIPVMLLCEDVSKKYFITNKRPPFNLDVSEYKNM